MIKKFLLSVLFFLFAALPTTVLPALDSQYENQLIEKVEVYILNQKESSSGENAIIKRIKSKPNTVFSQTDFDNDLKNLSKEFDRIEPIVDVVDDKVLITLKIWPKPMIRRIIWEGNSKVLTNILKQELAVSSGEIFDRLSFNKAFHKLQAYYVRKGYFEAQLGYVIIPSEEKNEVDIQIKIDEGRAGLIKEIRFENFTDEERDEVISMMTTSSYNFFTSWLTETGTYKDDAVQQDELVIVDFLQNLGYADASVEIKVSESKVQQERIIVTIIANKGERYYTGNVTFSGNSVLSEEEIQQHLFLKTGMPYSPELLRLTVKNLSDLYGKYGHIDAVINYEPTIVDNKCVYDIHFTIEEGEEFRVGLIRVFGNCYTKSSVILHETFLVPGEVFNILKLQRTEQRLNNIGYFKYVNVYAVQAEENSSIGPNFRDVHIEVEEKGTGNIGAFIGYSTQESLFGGANITESNFNIEGIRSIFTKGLRALRGGGEFANLTATIGNKSRSYVLSWSKPFFMDTLWVVGFDIETSSNRYVSDDYMIQTVGFTLRGMYPLNQFVKCGTHYRFKNSRIVTADGAPCELKKDAENAGVISAVGGTWIYDSTNHPIRPTCGVKSKAEGEFVGAGGEHIFLKMGYLNTAFLTFPNIDSCGVWKFRGDVQFIQPIKDGVDDIPIDERYFLGGNYLIRGFKPYKIGPLYGSNDPKGGVSLQFFSVEYSRPLISRVEAFLFLDSGSLTDKTFHVGKLYTSAGYGLKLAIFGGAPPLMLGMGYPINANCKSEVKRFFLTIEGKF